MLYRSIIRWWISSARYLISKAKYQNWWSFCEEVSTGVCVLYISRALIYIELCIYQEQGSTLDHRESSLSKLSRYFLTFLSPPSKETKFILRTTVMSPQAFGSNWNVSQASDVKRVLEILKFFGNNLPENMMRTLFRKLRENSSSGPFWLSSGMSPRQINRQRDTKPFS